MYAKKKKKCHTPQRAVIVKAPNKANIKKKKKKKPKRILKWY